MYKIYELPLSYDLNLTRPSSLMLECEFSHGKADT